MGYLNMVHLDLMVHIDISLAAVAVVLMDILEQVMVLQTTLPIVVVVEEECLILDRIQYHQHLLKMVK